MKLERVLPYSKKLLTLALSQGDIAIDATVGNGHDTLFLARLVGDSGHVYGFDIQKEALTNTSTLLQKEDVTNVTLIHDSHANVSKHLEASLHHKIKAAIFNLGYLPGGDKTITTTPDSTVNAINRLLKIMPSEGLIILVVYHGHPEGAVERDALLEYVSTIEQKQANVLQYRFLNQVNAPPFIIAIEKK